MAWITKTPAVRRSRSARTAWPALLGGLLAILLAGTAPAADEPTGSVPGAAKAILDGSGVQGGLVVHVGCGTGELTAELRANHRYLVHGLDRDAAKVQAARQRIRSLSQYGLVSVDCLAGKRLPYADNLVNLLVSEDLGDVPVEEVTRVLAPLGVACIKQEDAWTKTVKPWPKDIDEWTHLFHGPDGNPVAADEVVGPPRRVQWVGGPLFARHHNVVPTVTAMVSGGGRLFSVVDEAPAASFEFPTRWSLVAQDAFNGVVLWQRPIAQWQDWFTFAKEVPPELGRRLVVDGNTAYVTLELGAPVTALDAATGETVRTYAETKNAEEIVCSKGILFVVVGTGAPASAPERRRGVGSVPGAYNRRIPPTAKALIALKATSGEVLWRRTDQVMFPASLAVAGERALLAAPDGLVCLGARNGREVWRSPRTLETDRGTWTVPRVVIHGDVVLCADMDPRPEAPPAVAQDPNKAEPWQVHRYGALGKLGAVCLTTRSIIYGTFSRTIV